MPIQGSLRNKEVLSFIHYNTTTIGFHVVMISVCVCVCVCVCTHTRM